VRNHQPGGGNLVIVSGFGNYNGGVRFLFCAVARVVISIYDIQRCSPPLTSSRDSPPPRSAVAGHATVPIHYESRVANLGLNQSELSKIDEEFEAITEGEELTRDQNLKTKWAALERQLQCRAHKGYRVGAIHARP
jgi:hypothetical protein